MITRRRNPSKPLSYVAYFRISKKGGTGLGLEAQREAVARDAGNIPIIASFTEEESGKRADNRPQLKAALELCHKTGSCLLIAKLDRLARNVYFIAGLMESKVAFRACDMPDANRFTLHIMASMAEHEREMISERTKAGLNQIKAEIAAKGFRISRAGRRFEKLGNPNWAAALKKAMEARRPAPSREDVLKVLNQMRHPANGDKPASYREIANRLNKDLQLKSARSKRWHAASVRQALLKMSA